MGELFDRLPGEPRDDEGISTLDMLDLPADQRKIMRLMLRKGELTYPEICDALSALSESERLSPAAIESAIEALTKQRWIMKHDTGTRVSYKASLRRKVGSIATELHHRQRQSPLSQDFWATLDSKSRHDLPPETSSESSPSAESQPDTRKD